MLRVHFLNVGHGDCTVIEHPSGRLTMIDINNSQDYDSETFGEVLAEEREKQRTRALAGALAGLGGNTLTGFGGLGSLAGAVAPMPNALAEYTAAMATVKNEVTDPVAFMQKHYSGRRLWRFVLTHPDLDHMRGIKRLKELIGFDNFWDTDHTKPTPNFRSDADRDDWNFYQGLRRPGRSKAPPLVEARLKGFDDQNAFPAKQRLHHRVVARQRTRMRLSGFFAAIASAGMHDRDRLVALASFPNQMKKQHRPANLPKLSPLPS
jgi:hypothetical protein